MRAILGHEGGMTLARAAVRFVAVPGELPAMTDLERQARDAARNQVRSAAILEARSWT